MPGVLQPAGRRMPACLWCGCVVAAPDEAGSVCGRCLPVALKEIQRRLAPVPLFAFGPLFRVSAGSVAEARSASL